MEVPKERFDSAVRFAEVVETLLSEGRIKPHPKEVRSGGLEGILGGIQDMREGRVRGRKLVNTLGGV